MHSMFGQNIYQKNLNRKLEKLIVDMQNYSRHVVDDGKFVLPTGFRYHPKDKELIYDHLYPKVLDSSFSALAVGEVALNKFEPWELPWLGTMGEDEWYFFCLMYKKFRTSPRTNRATPAGHWKATGKDKEIYMGKALVGMKKSLVFYRGRAPNCQKTNWVMHEYKLAGIYSPCNLPNTAQNDWVICRVFLKTPSGQKVHKSNLMSSNPYGNETSPVMPTLVGSPSSLSETITTTVHETSRVTCFSNAMNGNNMQEDVGNMQYPEPVPIQQDQSRSRMLVDSNGPIMHRGVEAEIKHDGGGLTADVYPPLDTHDWQQSFGVQEDILASDGEYDFDSLPNFWN